MTTDQFTRPAQTSDLTPNRVRTGIIGLTLALGAAVVATVLLIRPWQVRNQFEYDDISPVRDAMWTGIVVDTVSFAVVGFTLGLVVCGLARTRGAAWANVGAVLTALGGVTFAMGAFGFAALAWYATDTAALTAADGARLLEYVVDNRLHVMVMQMAGFMIYTLGSLVLAVALLRARTITRWLPIALIVVTLAQFTPVPQRGLDLIQVAVMAVLIGIAGAYLRTTR